MEMPNSMTYGSPIDDPLYSAHKPLQIGNDTIYLPDHPFKVVGCAQQVSSTFFDRRGPEAKEIPSTNYATLAKGRKTSALLFSSAPVTPDDIFPDASPLQFAILRTFIQATWLFSTELSSRLDSVALMTANQIPSLRNGFWKQEVLGWEQEALASLQIAMAHYAIGPRTLDRKGQGVSWAKPETAAEKTQCTIQKMKAIRGFVNVNFFGLVFILTFSVLAMIIDLSLLKFLVYLSRFRRVLGPRIERWIQDGGWQLQRRAHEGEGYRNWMNLEAEIPLTEKAILLKDLPILRVPGKSPGIVQARTFGSMQGRTESREALRPVTSDASVRESGDVEEQQGVKIGGKWFMFWRRLGN